MEHRIELDLTDRDILAAARRLVAAEPASRSLHDVSYRLGQVEVELERMIGLVDRLVVRLQANLDSVVTSDDSSVSAHRDVQAALDRIAAWAPDTARRVKAALAGGVPQAAVIAWEMLAAVVVPESLEADRSTVLDALGALADGTPAVQS